MHLTDADLRLFVKIRSCAVDGTATNLASIVKDDGEYKDAHHHAYRLDHMGLICIERPNGFELAMRVLYLGACDLQSARAYAYDYQDEMARRRKLVLI